MSGLGVISNIEAITVSSEPLGDKEDDMSSHIEHTAQSGSRTDFNQPVDLQQLSRQSADLNSKMDGMDYKLRSIDQKLSRLEDIKTGLDDMKTGLDDIKTGLDGINQKLTELPEITRLLQQFLLSVAPNQRPVEATQGNPPKEGHAEETSN